MLAGLALRNGVIVISKDRWGVAVRSEDGDIATKSGSRRSMPKWVDTIPLAGPMLRVSEQLLLIPRIARAMPQAQLPMFAPLAISATVVGGLLATGARKSYGPGIKTELLAGAAGIFPMLIGLRFDPVARYHGAEHKTIAGYEQDIPAREASRLHPRCGTTLALPTMVLGAAARAILGPRSKAAGLLGTAASLELVRAAVRRPSSPGGQALIRSGMFMQRVFTTAEPTDGELEVGRAAMDAALDGNATNR
jgi:uncharacterized protein YqhQ